MIEDFFEEEKAPKRRGRGRPVGWRKGFSERHTRTVSLSMNEDLINAVKEIAQKKGVTAHSLMIQAVTDAVNAERASEVNP